MIIYIENENSFGQDCSSPINLINYTDLIIMTETKIDEQVKASEFLPKGYNWRY